MGVLFLVSSISTGTGKTLRLTFPLVSHVCQVAIIGQREKRCYLDVFIHLYRFYPRGSHGSMGQPKCYHKAIHLPNNESSAESICWYNEVITPSSPIYSLVFLFFLFHWQGEIIHSAILLRIHWRYYKERSCNRISLLVKYRRNDVLQRKSK